MRIQLPLLAFVVLASAVPLGSAARAQTTPSTGPADVQPNEADVKKKSTPAAFDPTGAYNVRTIRGWKIRVNRGFANELPAVCEQTLAVLDQQLFQITRSIPAPALKKLRKIEIWIEKDDPLVKCMCYHVSDAWVRDSGLNPDKTKCLELGNARTFLRWTITQPWMVLHELAHGYHDQFMQDAYENEDVLKAYRSAMKAKLYGPVKFIEGGEHDAYAATNPMEYFAEGTEALFGTNDFYPFVRAELKEHDPKGYAMLRRAWGVDPAPK